MRHTVLHLIRFGFVAALFCPLAGCNTGAHITVPLGSRNLSDFDIFHFEYRFLAAETDGLVQDAIVQRESDGRYTVQLTIYHPGEPDEQLPARDLTADETARMLGMFSSVRFMLYVPAPGAGCPETLLAIPIKVFTWDHLEIAESSCSLHPHEFIADTDVDAIYGFLQDLVPAQ